MRNNELTRRGFLAAAGAGLGGVALPGVAAQAPAESGHGCAPRAEDWTSTSDQPPRKVIVGTVMQPFWVKYPGLENRLHELAEILDRMQALSQSLYGRGLDLAVLPEIAVTGEVGATGDVADASYPLAGPVRDAFARKARELHCYIVAPLYLLEDQAAKVYSNAAVLFARQGEVAGVYRKAHPVVDSRTGSMEHGATPGKEEPVFACDFGKLGIQICYDMDFNSGWRELARHGAEIIAWPTQSPQTARPVRRAIEGHCYIVSSTWRNNASIFEPTGKIISQVRQEPDAAAPGGGLLENNVSAQEIDLSYAIIPWSAPLKNGKLFTETFGDKAGFHYYEDDDRGIFWSNDPHTTVRQMLVSLNLREEQEELTYARQRYHQAGVPGY